MPEHAAVSESPEKMMAQPSEMMIRTSKGALRGDVVRAVGTERIVKTTWAQDGVGVGSFVRFDAATAKLGEPLRIGISTDGGQNFQERTTANLERAGRWERGEHISLEELVESSEQHSESESLPVNTESEEEHYAEQLAGYEYVSEGIAYSNQQKDSAKCNFAFGTPNEGWKVHLNVAPEQVAGVSAYLKENGYAHKYLTGGNGTEGKAFTVYFGAKSMMDRWAQTISRDLHEQLRKPSVEDEAEVSTGIVARFTALDEHAVPEEQFLQYGFHGLSARRTFIVQNGGWDAFTTPELKRAASADAYEHLSEKYGSYFSG